MPGWCPSFLVRRISSGGHGVLPVPPQQLTSLLDAVFAVREAVGFLLDPNRGQEPRVKVDVAGGAEKNEKHWHVHNELLAKNGEGVHSGHEVLEGHVVSEPVTMSVGWGEHGEVCVAEGKLETDEINRIEEEGSRSRLVWRLEGKKARESELEEGVEAASTHVQVRHEDQKLVNEHQRLALGPIVGTGGNGAQEQAPGREVDRQTAGELAPDDHGAKGDSSKARPFGCQDPGAPDEHLVLGRSWESACSIALFARLHSGLVLNGEGKEPVQFHLGGAAGLAGHLGTTV
mmetsp:Transcript_3069/g.8833  ORF Transcript_3069/g.8833 Transcript_3069/m.8833 type:complete len:288 (-) Transcript_3069:926-1789(-)